MAKLFLIQFWESSLLGTVKDVETKIAHSNGHQIGFGQLEVGKRSLAAIIDIIFAMDSGRCEKISGHSNRYHHC